jgi:hypothetical protein
MQSRNKGGAPLKATKSGELTLAFGSASARNADATEASAKIKPPAPQIGTATDNKPIRYLATFRLPIDCSTQAAYPEYASSTRGALRRPQAPSSAEGAPTHTHKHTHTQTHTHTHTRTRPHLRAQSRRLAPTRSAGQSQRNQCSSVPLTLGAVCQAIAQQSTLSARA